MNSKAFKVLFTLLLTSGLFISCSKDPVIENEEELITEVRLVLTPERNDLSVVNYLFTDQDGDGGAAPVIRTEGKLVAGAAYNASLTFRNTLSSSIIEITDEIKQEALEHQVFYVVSEGLKGALQFTYNDADSNGFPLGLITRCKANAPGQGYVQIILKHTPDKAAAGVREGNPANAGGETDADISFPVVIE